MKEEFAKELLEKIINCEEAWKKPWKDFNDAQKGFYYNDFSYSYNGRLYKGLNQLLLPAGVYITFASAVKLGFQIKKGAKAYTILQPNSFKVKVEEEKLLDFLETFEKKTVEYRGFTFIFEKGSWYKIIVKDFKPMKVFRHTDVFGMNLPEADRLMEINKNDKNYDFINKYTEANGIKLIEGGNECFFSPDLDIIMTPKKEMFDSDSEFYLSLFHELSHSTSKPLKRKIYALNENKEGYALEEVIAETSALMLGKEFKIVENENNSFSYLKAWSEKLDAGKILESIKKGFEVSNYLLSYN